MSLNGDDLDDVKKALRDEVSFVPISCAHSCSICGKPSSVYLHPIEDGGTACVACEGCSGNLIAEGTHREYPFEVSAEGHVDKRIVHGKDTFRLVVVSADGVPDEGAWARMTRADTLLVACHS